MGPEELLVMAMALPPMCVAARLWWSVRHAAAELGDFRVVVPGAARPAADAAVPPDARR